MTMPMTMPKFRSYYIPNMKGLGLVVSEKNIFSDFPMKNLLALESGHFWPGGINLNKLSRGPLGDNTYQISKL